SQPRHRFVRCDGAVSVAAPRAAAGASRGAPGPPAGERLPQSTREWSVAAVVAIGAAAVVAMWWGDTPAGSLHGLADDVTAIGRLTGLLGTYVLLVGVALLARAPWLDRFIGMDRLAVWHRRTGEYVVTLLTAHAAASVVGYALTDRVGVVSEARTVALRYPDMLMAVVALALLLMVGGVSARAVRSRMRYHTWYFLHLYTYLAVVLALPHQLATGQELADHPLSRGFWVALHLVPAAMLLAYRVGAPLMSARRHRMRVASVEREGGDVVSITIRGRHLDDLGTEPGQFFLWRFLTRDRWWQAHPFSLSARPDASRLRITVRTNGDFTSGLPALHPGTRVIAEGPYGNVTLQRRTRRKVLLIGGGIGIAPLRAMLDSVSARAGEVSVIYRASTDDDVVLRDELDALAARRRARLAYVIGPRDPDPLPPDRLRASLPDVAEHDAFVFGSGGFVDHVTSLLRRVGVPSAQIHAERFEF
ncbi:MAG TPA: ferredoxin reductase family protein, partial [Acidimicrobiales bacterium]|nr:ferredoxin reductase family protein [Acidimicrobiales bacterium]